MTSMIQRDHPPAYYQASTVFCCPHTTMGELMACSGHMLLFLRHPPQNPTSAMDIKNTTEHQEGKEGSPNESPGFGRRSNSTTKLQLPHQNVLNYSVPPTFRLQRKRETVLSKCKCSSTELLNGENTEAGMCSQLTRQKQHLLLTMFFLYIKKCSRTEESKTVVSS